MAIPTTLSSPSALPPFRPSEAGTLVGTCLDYCGCDYMFGCTSLTTEDLDAGHPHGR